MASVSEIRSLDEINYKIRIKYFIMTSVTVIIFIMAFLSFYPVGDKIRTQIKSNLKKVGCQADFQEIGVEWFLPKFVVSNIVIPAHCFGKEGEPLKLNFIKVNWHLINFSPLGIPFRLDTEFAGRPLSLYYVLGYNQQMIRLKDQKINLSRLYPLLSSLKLNGNATIDMNLLQSAGTIKSLSLKSVSKDFGVPAQNLDGFNLPNLPVNDLYLEINSENHPKLEIEKLIIGDSNSPIRANFKGRIDLVPAHVLLSGLSLNGEVAFSQNFRDTMPILDLMFHSFTQKDGFYQIRLGGTLMSPQPMAP
jgi:hypothetical protein